MKRFSPYHLLALSSILSISIAFSYLFGVTTDRPLTHYHANIYLFRGESLVDLSLEKYMEEIASCGIEDNIRPQDRVHLHERNASTIHIHAPGVTWTDFLLNIRHEINSRVWVDAGSVWGVTEGEKIAFFLNGTYKPAGDILNTRIESNDTLVVMAYSGKEIPKIPNLPPQRSAEYNTKNDPATCSGQKEQTFLEHLGKMKTRLFGDGHAHTH